MWNSVRRVAVATVVAVPLAAGILVAPGSPCSRFCGNTLSSTSGSEMVCTERAYAETSPGTVFSGCLGCELSSTYASEKQTDQQSLTYNLRFNLGYCLWGELGNTDANNNPCITATACEPFKDAISYQNYTKSVGAYDYCQHWESPLVGRCTSCLRGLDDAGYYLSNYITTLDAACQQKPEVGSTVSIQGSIFESTPVVITTPSPTYATVPAPDYGPVSLGARVGIAFGGLALILAIVGFCIVCNGKRRRRAFLRQLERRHGHHNARYGHGDMLETPASQKPLTGWDESPVSAHTITPVPRYFSPYNSQYNSPVSANDGTPSTAGAAAVNWPALAPQRLNQLIQEQSPAHGSPPPAFTQWPSPTQEKLMMQMHHERRQNEIAIGIALGGDEASLRSKGSNPSINNPAAANALADEGKGKDREMYEMHEVESPYNGNADPSAYKMPVEPGAPVLHHPGYGRHHSRPGTGSSGGKSAQFTPNYGMPERNVRTGTFV